MKKFCILIVDDEPGMLEVCADTLAGLPHTTICTESDSRLAAARLREGGIDLLITDVCMPGLDGIELQRIAREQDPELPVLVLTAYPKVETAVEAMKLGATDYITKPFNPDDLRHTVERLIGERRLREENQLLRRQLERGHAFGDMLGGSAAMRKVFEIIERVAETDVDVLVIGETGTGKELVARSLHRKSPRKNGPFVPVDCGAIPEELMESEFFGYEKGAFTGAASRNIGLLEYAEKGTLMLDEIGQLPLRLQAKLLRALQERTIRRLGSTREIEVDVRIIAATSLDLEEEVRAERFRLDFFYRINVARIDLPPLRLREGDIPLLVDTFSHRFAAEMNREHVEISPETMEVLCAYSWPGNVRELQNVLKRTLAMVRHARIQPGDLPDAIVTAAGEFTGQPENGFFSRRNQKVAAFEKEYFTGLLRDTSGDVTLAAKQANLPRGTLYRLLKNHEIDPAGFRPE